MAEINYETEKCWRLKEKDSYKGVAYSSWSRFCLDLFDMPYDTVEDIARNVSVAEFTTWGNMSYDYTTCVSEWYFTTVELRDRFIKTHNIKVESE